MDHKGLPVAGYKAQSDDKVGLVIRNKELEERVLRVIDELMCDDGIDRRWLSVGRTHIEQGFMAVNRAVFQPGRVKLPDDVIELPEGAVGEDENLTHEEAKRRKTIVDASSEELARELTRRQEDGEAVEYSEGICGDGAAILKDGVPMSIPEVIAELQRS